MCIIIIYNYYMKLINNDINLNLKNEKSDTYNDISKLNDHNDYNIPEINLYRDDLDKLINDDYITNTQILDDVRLSKSDIDSINSNNRDYKRRYNKKHNDYDDDYDDYDNFSNYSNYSNFSSYKPKIFDIFHEPFNLHFLFDGYIDDHIGNHFENTISNFKKYNDDNILNKLLDQSNDIFELKYNLISIINIGIEDIIKYDKKKHIIKYVWKLVEKIISYLSNINKKYNDLDKILDKYKFFAFIIQIYKKIETIINNIYDNYIQNDNYYYDDYDDYDNYDNYKRQNQDKKNQNKKNKDEYLCKTRIDTILKVLLVNNFRNIIFIFNKLLILSYPKLIHLGGYNNSVLGGHLVGVYYSYENDNNYNVIITNSGQGVDTYHSKLDKKYQVITINNNISLNKLANILTTCDICHHLDIYEANIDIFYKNIIYNLRLDTKYITSINDKYYYYPQKSGSCSFYGIYYILRYLLGIHKFYDMVNLMKDKIIKQMIEYFYNNPKIYYKNFIDILNLQNLIPSDYDKLNLYFENLTGNYNEYIKDEYTIDFKYKNPSLKKNDNKNVNNNAHNDNTDNDTYNNDYNYTNNYNNPIIKTEYTYDEILEMLYKNEDNNLENIISKIKNVLRLGYNRFSNMEKFEKKTRLYYIRKTLMKTLNMDKQYYVLQVNNIKNILDIINDIRNILVGNNNSIKLINLFIICILLKINDNSPIKFLLPSNQHKQNVINSLFLCIKHNITFDRTLENYLENYSDYLFTTKNITQVLLKWNDLQYNSEIKENYLNKTYNTNCNFLEEIYESQLRNIKNIFDDNFYRSLFVIFAGYNSKYFNSDIIQIIDNFVVKQNNKNVNVFYRKINNYASDFRIKKTKNNMEYLLKTKYICDKINFKETLRGVYFNKDITNNNILINNIRTVNVLGKYVIDKKLDINFDYLLDCNIDNKILYAILVIDNDLVNNLQNSQINKIIDIVKNINYNFEASSYLKKTSRIEQNAKYLIICKFLLYFILVKNDNKYIKNDDFFNNLVDFCIIVYREKTICFDLCYYIFDYYENIKDLMFLTMQDIIKKNKKQELPYYYNFEILEKRGYNIQEIKPNVENNSDPYLINSVPVIVSKNNETMMIYLLRTSLYINNDSLTIIYDTKMNIYKGLHNNIIIPELYIEFDNIKKAYICNDNKEKLVILKEGNILRLINRLEETCDLNYLSSIDNNNKVKAILYFSDYTITFNYDENNNLLMNNEYIISFDNTKLFNNLVYDIPGSILIKSNETYKIVNFGITNINKFILNIMNSPWVSYKYKLMYKNSKNNYGNFQEKLLENISKYIQNKYSIIDIHYTGLYLIFNNINDMIVMLLKYNYASNLYAFDQLYDTVYKYLLNNELEIDLPLNNPYKYYYFTKESMEFITRKDIYPKHYNKIDNFIKSNEEIKLNRLYNKPLDSIRKLCDYGNNLIKYSDKNDITKILNHDLIKILNEHNITDNLIKFYNDYEYCEDIKIEIPLEKIIKLENIFKEKIMNSYDKNYVIFNRNFYDNETLIEEIFKNIEELYKILEYKKILIIIQGIKEICILNNNCHCSEINKLKSLLDIDKIYDGPRNKTLQIFEIMFGNFIKNIQYTTIQDILNNFNSNNHSIYQMLMGEGKTSVITPYILIDTLLNGNNNNILITSPKHLTTQTFDNLHFNYYPLLYSYSINLLNIKIQRETHNLTKYFEKNLYLKNIIILDDESLKTLLLNEVFNDDSLTKKKLRTDTLCIIDEVDNLLNPLTSDLNFPVVNNSNLEKHIIKFLINVVNILIPSELYFENKEKAEIYMKNTFINNKNSICNVFLQNSNEVIIFDEIVSRKKIRNIYDNLKLCLTLIYNQNYGFDNEIDLNMSKKDNFVAIPYKYSNDPNIGSEYSDYIQTIILSILSYKYNKLRHIDFLVIFEHLINIMKTNINYEIFKYSNLSAIEIFEKHNISLSLMIDDEIYKNQICNELLKILDDNEKNILINYYLETIIFPKYIIITEKKYNTSFIDVIDSGFIKDKIAFSGTVNILIPKFLNDADNFINIKTSDIANGSIISSIIGFINLVQVHRIKFDSDINIIFDIIINNNYDAIIDTGALFKNYTQKEFINKFINYVKSIKKTNFNKYNIYINKTYVYIEDNIIKTHNNKSLKITDNMFYYYDNQHTVGTDIKQPYKLNGLVTINYFNRLTDISQGIYRLRNVNYGHKINFLVNSTIIKKPTVMRIIHFLFNAENKYLKNSYNKYKIQNIKTLNRIYNNYNKSSYLDAIEDEEISLDYRIKDINIRNIFSNVINNVNNDIQIALKINTKINQNLNINLNINRNIEKPNNILARLKDKKLSITVEDLLNLNINQSSYIKYNDDTIDYSCMYYLNECNIYITPYLLRKYNMLIIKPLDNIDIFKNDICNLDKYSKNINYMINNCHYIKKNINGIYKYLLISPPEYVMIRDYLSRNQDKKFESILKDKSGNIIMINNLITQDNYNDTEIIIKIITCSNIKYNEYKRINNLNNNLFQKNKNIYKYFDKLRITMNYIFNNQITIKSICDFYSLYKNKAQAKLKTMYDNKEYGKILDIMDIPRNNSTELIQFIKNEFI